MVSKFIFILVLSLCINSCFISSLGVTPAHYVEHFEPGLEKTYEFEVYGFNAGVNVSVLGDLSEYVTLESTFITGGEKIRATIKLPEVLEKPGRHRILIEALDQKENESGATMIGGLAAIRVPIDILVPYPGKYIESEFLIGDINEGENSSVEISIDNLGTEDLVVKPKIYVYENGLGEKLVFEKNFGDHEILTKRRLTIKDELDTEKFSTGIYYAELVIDYGGQEKLNKTFRVGEFLVEIVDYDYMFEIGKINQFNVQIENKWNSDIKEVYAEVVIVGAVKEVAKFKTYSINAKPWETKNLTGYFDSNGFEIGRHTAKINLYYDGSYNSKLVAIYLVEPEKERDYRIYIISGIILIALIILIVFIYLLIKIKRLTLAARKRK